MATKKDAAVEKKELIPGQDRQVVFKADGQEIILNPSIVLKQLAHNTKSGKAPSESDVVKFIMLCKTQGLNPWVGDAYLVGFDTSDGPVFNLITSIQALLKRAEMNEGFNGIESGIIYTTKDDPNTPLHSEGSFVMPGWKLVGGWARVHRKDREMPFYDALVLDTYDTKRSRWAKDKPGMIVKCARAAALRQAFPTVCGALYTQEEMDSVGIQSAANEAQTRAVKRSVQDFTQEVVGEAEAEADAKQQRYNSLLMEPKEEPDAWVARMLQVIKEAGDEVVDLIPEVADQLVSEEAITDENRLTVMNSWHWRQTEESTDEQD